MGDKRGVPADDAEDERSKGLVEFEESVETWPKREASASPGGST